ncbi:hypothetical protein BDZ89DRAFT_1064470 [Hymenopellis radicata]|nr:hypothetical protein BDZ89DRAFT_1064470 [Hymenopellis radicata]
MGVTLWIVPSRKDAEKLKHIMDIRPRSLEASYPSFEPHITLLSLPADSTISLPELRASIPTTPLKISFNSVNIGDHFFRSVYIAVKPTPSSSYPALPHISLCYITDEDAALGERTSFYNALKDAGRMKPTQDNAGVSLNCSQGAGEDWVSTFEASEVWITECNGPVESWKILDKVSLS